jgi:hypothetical protein
MVHLLTFILFIRMMFKFTETSCVSIIIHKKDVQDYRDFTVIVSIVGGVRRVLFVL